MELKEFKHALHIGLGRAILHLQNNDTEKYRDITLHACLHNTTHDQLSEGDKSTYMMDIIKLTNEPDYYITHIKRAAKGIDDNTNDEDALHLLDMLGYLIRKGDREAKEILFDLFIRTRQFKTIRGGKHLVRLYGFKGFRFVAARLGEIALSQPDFEDDRWHVLLHLPHGENQETIVNEMREDDIRIDAYMNAIERNKQKKEQLESSTKTLPYKELKEHFVELENKQVSIREWAQNASESDIEQAAREFEDATDEITLKILTRIFQVRNFPLSPEALFKHIEHPIAYIRSRVFGLLERMNDDSIHEFAKSLIQKKRYIGDAIRLINVESTNPDWNLISSVLEYDLSSGDYHDLQLTVNSLLNVPATQQVKDILLHLYEYGSCSFCREGIVKKMNAVSTMTDRIKAECFHDSWLDTRKFAATNF